MMLPNQSRSKWGALCGCLIALSSGLAADAWPRFRGPDGNGVAPTIAPSTPLTWDRETNVTWRSELPGQGWSSPVIGEDQIYLSAAIPFEGGDDFSLALIIMDANSGQTIRVAKLMDQRAEDAPQIHQKNSHASPTPILSGDRVYVHFGHQGTACTDRAGNVLWTQRDLAFLPTHGNGGSPVLVDDKLIFTCDGGRRPTVAALNTQDGSIAWQVERPVDAARKFSFCTPTVIEVNRQTQVVAPGSDCVLGLDPDSGRIVWQVNYDGYSVVPKPVFANGRVYVATGFNRASLLAIRPDGTGDVTDTHVEWSTKKSIPKTPSIVATGDLLLLVSDDGIASCLEQATGEEVWKERLGGGFSSSPTLIGDRLYMTAESGKTVVVRAARQFEKLAENDLGERTLASMAVAGSAIYLRTADALYRLEAK